MEEGFEAVGVGSGHIGVGLRALVGEIQAEHAALAVGAESEPRLFGRLAQALHQLRCARGQLFVETGTLDDFQCFQASRHGHGVARQRARLIHAAQRRNAVHDFFFAAHSCHRHPAADDFAHRGHIGRDAVQRLRAAQRHAEAGHYLVVNQHCAVLRGGLAQGLDEFGAGAHQVHIARDGFQNHAGNLAGEFVKGLFQRGNVVIRQDDGVLRQIGGNACGAGIAEGE